VPFIFEAHQIPFRDNKGQLGVTKINHSQLYNKKNTNKKNGKQKRK